MSKGNSKKGKSPKAGNWKPSRKSTGRDAKPRQAPALIEHSSGPTRLNKFLANAGVCSRREADTLIQTGIVSVNNKTVTQLGTKVMPGDVVKLNGETLSTDALRYVLLNKPKNFVSTVDDARGRKTVMNLVVDACKERIFPVGKLERDTTGLLLFTNDQALSKKLTHPKKGFPQLFLLSLDKKVRREHLDALLEGIKTKEGSLKVAKIDYVNNDPYR
ncbi:MAG: rRNA pseudouridine synthase, partial [Flavobacteriales bacterium]|nr:rRNA pseudouridine synthase [Flavobacteriales bacterium]